MRRAPRLQRGRWTGSAQIGGSEAWVNGTLNPNTFAHELGHNLGLYHSHSLYCGATVIGTNCTVVEYGNVTDTMGFGFSRYNAFQKERLGWVNYGMSPHVPLRYYLADAESLVGLEGEDSALAEIAAALVARRLQVFPGCRSFVPSRAADSGRGLILEP